MYSLNYSPNYIYSTETKFKNGGEDFGYISYKNGDKYEGYMKNHVARGDGRLTLSTGAYYEGRFDDSGLCDGVFALPKGLYFRDTFDCDCFVEGSFFFSDGTVFEGAWNLDDEEWVVVEGQLRTKEGQVVASFDGDNLVKFDNEEQTRVKIVFVRCSILGNSSFYEGGFNPDTQTLDGQGVVVNSTRKYSLTCMKNGRKEGQWLFVNYWEDLPYTKRVDFEDDQKVHCRTTYANGLHFEGKDDFGEGVATFPHICDWVQVEGVLSGNNACPVMKGVLSVIGGSEKGPVEISEDNGNLKTLFDEKTYSRLEDLLEAWNPPKPSEAKNSKFQSPKIKKNIVTSIMMSQNDPSYPDSQYRSRKSSRSRGRKTSKVRGISPRGAKNKRAEFYDEGVNKEGVLKSKARPKSTFSKLSKISKSLKSSSSEKESKRLSSKLFRTNNSGNHLRLEEIELGGRLSEQGLSYLKSDEELSPNRMIDLISEKPLGGSPVISPSQKELSESLKNKSHFSFNHSIQDLQSFDGVRVDLMDSDGIGTVSQPQSIRGVLSPNDVLSVKVFAFPGESGSKVSGKEYLMTPGVSSKMIRNSGSLKDSSSRIFRQNPSETMKTFFVEKDNRILLFKDIQNFYSSGEENLRLTGKMIAYALEFQYQGNIVNDQMHGEGQLQIEDKTFSGNFKNNQLEQGSIDYGKMVYKGQIRGLKKHGQGEVQINKAVVRGCFVDDVLDEGKDVRVELEGRDVGKVEVISTKNEGMYLLSQLTDDNMFIFDIKKFIFRKSY